MNIHEAGLRIRIIHEFLDSMSDKGFYLIHVSDVNAQEDILSPTEAKAMVTDYVTEEIIKTQDEYAAKFADKTIKLEDL